MGRPALSGLSDRRPRICGHQAVVNQVWPRVRTGEPAGPSSRRLARDVWISNGVINLCQDKAAVFAEIHRVLRPGGTLQFADIANGNPVPDAARRNIDLWTG